MAQMDIIIIIIEGDNYYSYNLFMWEIEKQRTMETWTKSAIVWKK
jgi:hypothetical protein